MRKFEKEFRLQHPQTVGETDKDFDNHNYTDFLESVLEKMAEPSKEECEKMCGENHCDENGCTNRKRILVEPKEEQPEKISFWVEQSIKKDIEISELKSEVEKAKELIKLAQNLPAISSEDARKKWSVFMNKSTTF